MFQLVGYGDHAGSGLPKIYTNWAGQHWRRPVLYEAPEPEQTLMELRMSSLVPEQAAAELTKLLGARFAALPETARLALITAQVEGLVSHDRLKPICTEHPADLTKMLRGLVRDGFLVPAGAGRGMVYFLPWQRRSAATVFDLTDQEDLATNADVVPPELGVPTSSPAVPYLDWSSLPEALQAQLIERGRLVSEQGRVAPVVLRETILALCTNRLLGLRVLAQALQRDPDDLRKRTLTLMVKEGALHTAYPSMTDPRQAYTVSTNFAENKE